MNQKNIWDAIAKKWNEYRSEPFGFVSKFIKKQKGKILDLGCGSGRHFLKQPGLKFYGVDFSSEILKLAEKKNIAFELKKANATNLPYPDKFFDSAIFIASLSCIESAEKRKKSLEELHRVLKPGSQAMITVWSKNSERLKNKPISGECFVPWTVNGRKYNRYYYIYDKEELELLLKKAGFKIIKSFEDENIVMIVKKI